MRQRVLDIIDEQSSSNAPPPRGEELAEGRLSWSWAATTTITFLG